MPPVSIWGLLSDSAAFPMERESSAEETLQNAEFKLLNGGTPRILFSFTYANVPMTSIK